MSLIKKLSKDRNWAIIPFIIGGLFALVAGLSSLKPQEEISKNIKEEINQIDNLKSEYKKLKLPNKTAINSVNEHSRNKWFYVIIKYRTELNKKDFFDDFSTKMFENDWDLITTKKNITSNEDLNFCKENMIAKLTPESKYIWNQEKANYYGLKIEYNSQTKCSK